MSKFKNSGLFKTVGKAATIRGSTGPTEYFEFVHEECGQKTGFLKFLDSEETSYKSSGKNVAYRVGKFQVECPKCKEAFVIKMSFSQPFKAA